MRLSQLFAQLNAGGGAEQLSALPFPGGSPHRIAKTADGRPVVLFGTPSDLPEHCPPASRMANIGTTFARRAKLHQPGGGTEESVFASVELRTPDTALYPFFLDALQAVGDQLPGATTGEELAPLLDRVFQIFRALGGASKTTPLGAWGELLVMSESPRADDWVRNWHAHPEDVVDFASDSTWVEVKTTSAEGRRHQVTLRQISPPPTSRGFLVSVNTVQAAGGTTLRALATRVSSRLTPEMRLKLEEVLAAQLGKEYATAMDVAYDEQTARASIQSYRMGTLPRVPMPLPPQVSDVRFILDLSGVTPDGTGLGGMFG